MRLGLQTPRQNPVVRKAKKSSTERHKDAATARDFFEIIFDAKDEMHEREQAELNYYLESTDITNSDDIRKGAFFLLCL